MHAAAESITIHSTPPPTNFKMFRTDSRPEEAPNSDQFGYRALFLRIAAVRKTRPKSASSSRSRSRRPARTTHGHQRRYRTHGMASHRARSSDNPHLDRYHLDRASAVSAGARPSVASRLRMGSKGTPSAASKTGPSGRPHVTVATAFRTAPRRHRDHLRASEPDQASPNCRHDWGGNPSTIAPVGGVRTDGTC